jgi:hypothetical protein
MEPIMSETISAWSFSRLDDFESCPLKAKYKYIDKIPQPPLVIPEGKTEHPMTRGGRIHNLAELYVLKNITLAPELELFKDQFLELRTLYRENPGKVEVEEQWAFDTNWNKTGWFSKDTWGRLMLDVCVNVGEPMRVIDHKTGKKYPPKHSQQGQLYGLVASMRYPEISRFRVEFWYLDSGEEYIREYSRTQLQIFKDDFDNRGRTMTTTTDFEPRPSRFSCRFCPYADSDQGNGFCESSYDFSPQD